MTRSPLQLDLTPTDIADYLKIACPDARIAWCGELSGGGYAAVWKASLTDGRDVVLKVGPPSHVRQLRYERDLMRAEARYYRMVRPLGVPVPEVIHEEEEWLCVSHLPGRPLSDVDFRGGGDAVRRELGAAMAKVHSVKGEWFGYTGDRPSGPSWRDVFGMMVEDIIADARDWDVPLPVAPQQIRAVIEAGALDEVTRPALVHFDLWDGNVLTPDGIRLSGLVDGERYLYGDPLMDFVSPAILHPLEAILEHPYTAGYGGVEWDEAALWRLALYRMHLLLLMVAECPSRGMSAETLARRQAWLLRQHDEFAAPR